MEVFRDGDFIAEKYLGSGSFGSVYLVVDKSGKLFALKRIHLRFGNLNEAALLAGLPKHRHIVEYHDHWEDYDGLYLVMQYCAHGTLKQMIEIEDDWKRLGEENLLQYLCQIASAIAHLHKHGIIHRDLKPDNIFFSINTLRVGDLGLATNTSQDRITKAGTFFFMSPQALFGKQYGAKTDVYSFGCIAYNMLMRETPYVTEDVFALD
eukprot:Rmarinus@m.15379